MDINYQYAVNVRNKCDIIQETSEKHTRNDKDKNLIIIHIEAAYRPSQEPNVEFPKKNEITGKNKRNPTNASVQKH